MKFSPTSQRHRPRCLLLANDGRFCDGRRAPAYYLRFQYSRITNATMGSRKSPISANSSFIPLRLGVTFIRVVVRFICLQ